ncbi:MAG: GTPase, partial [Thermoguttaceae bacterium]
NKLLPQLELPPLLVVAIIGGTNIGKSVIFNHLAGENASAVTPLAAGTKHPVCLAPPEIDDPQLLQRLFEPFHLLPWHSADDPLSDDEDNCLYWRVGRRMPSRLLLIDAPDVDSDVMVNWSRAKAIRQCADVLLAVLTQQKYNDAAVKQFFRAAAEADKPIIIIFNQCELQADDDYWPQWLSTFRQQIGAGAQLVYVAPYDRRGAERLCLPFYSVGRDGRAPLGEAVDLRNELAALRFDEIKIRTFRGAISRILDHRHGAWAYLQSIRLRADEFSAAAKALSAQELARVDWPALPPSILVEEIGRWWDEQREAWSRRIHGFYRFVGRGATWPLRALWQNVAGESADPLLAFQQQERTAIISAVKNLLDELDRLAQVGNDTLRPRLQALLGGRARADLLERVQAAHQLLPAVDEHYRAFLRAELDAWRKANPRAIRFVRSLDNLLAMARPAVSVGLFFTGLHFAGDIVGQAAVQAASHTAGQLAGEAAITGGIAGGGEVLLSTTGEGVSRAAGRLFSHLQSSYAKQRAQWLADWLESELLGGLLDELRQGAALPHSEAFKEVESILQAMAIDADAKS